MDNTQEVNKDLAMIRKDISDEELHVVMNRKLLFDSEALCFTSLLNNNVMCDDIDEYSCEPSGDVLQGETAVKVRVEGDMYDIISSGADEIFTSLR